LSTKTVQRILDRNGILRWRAKKRPALTKEHVVKRLAWAKARENWTKDDFRNHMWSDECSAERGKGKA